MPSHARGAHYFGQIAGYMSCPINHEGLANELYVQILGKDKKGGGTQTRQCENCQTTIVVSARPGGEWETRYFPGKKETENTGENPEIGR